MPRFSEIIAELYSLGFPLFTGHFICNVVYMEIYIRNMICSRCKMVVEIQLERLGFHCRSIEIGRADIIEELAPEDVQQIKLALQRCGLDIVDSKRGVLVDKIKSTVLEMIHGPNEQLKSKFSDYLVSKLKYDYTYLANIFSESESTTIEQFIITSRIEAAKELLLNSDLSLTEISWKLNFSSVAHLSTQFKKITGRTPSLFRQAQLSSMKMCEL